MTRQIERLNRLAGYAREVWPRSASAIYDATEHSPGSVGVGPHGATSGIRNAHVIVMAGDASHMPLIIYDEDPDHALDVLEIGLLAMAKAQRGER